MFRNAFLLATLTLARIGFAQEIPPFDSAPVPNLMSVYTNTELSFTIAYPKEFTPGTVMDLSAVMDRGHRAAYGTAPDTDPEHQEAVRCMHPLLYATAGAGSASQESKEAPDDSLDWILIIDVDRSCMPKKLKGEKALTALAGTILHMPDFTQLVQQMWFVAGGDRRIHSGMAGTMLTLGAPSTDNGAPAPPRKVPYYVMASSFEQK